MRGDCATEGVTNEDESARHSSSTHAHSTLAMRHTHRLTRDSSTEVGRAVRALFTFPHTRMVVGAQRKKLEGSHMSGAPSSPLLMHATMAVLRGDSSGSNSGTISTCSWQEIPSPPSPAVSPAVAPPDTAAAGAVAALA